MLSNKIVSQTHRLLSYRYFWQSRLPFFKKIPGRTPFVSLNVVLTENTLLELHLDALFDLMRLNIEEIKLLRRNNADQILLLELVDEIMLIQEVINKKNSEGPTVQ